MPGVLPAASGTGATSGGGVGQEWPSPAWHAVPGRVCGIREMACITLKPGHVQPVWAGHPWVYAQAIERVEGGAGAGDEVQVKDARGNLLGRGLYSPGSA